MRKMERKLIKLILKRKQRAIVRYNKAKKVWEVYDNKLKEIMGTEADKEKALQVLKDYKEFLRWEANQTEKTECCHAGCEPEDCVSFREECK